MKKVSGKFISVLIGMIMMFNLIMPLNVYASVDTDEETVVDEAPTSKMTANEATGDEATADEATADETTSDEATAGETIADEKGVNKEEEDAELPEEIIAPFNESSTIGDVTITVNAEAGAFPVGSYLDVKEIALDTDMSSDDEILAVSYSYDITIYDKDGKETEPAEGKDVSVSFCMDEIADSNLDTSIYHTSDDGTVTELDITTSGDTAIVATDSFSVYTVEFTYGELTYEMNGDTSIRLNDILASVGLSGEATNVECSDTSFFCASDETGEWVVSAHGAFSTTEWMKVTIEDVVYEIKVTDAQSGSCGANVTWSASGGILTISGTGAMDDLAAVPWFSCGITTAIISDGVTSIGRNAFRGCTDLNEVILPGSVTSIGDSAFYNCTGLSSITIPTGVTSIGYCSFKNCSSLCSIILPASVTSIDGQAFGDCVNLSLIIIPERITSIASSAFENINRNAVIYYDGEIQLFGVSNNRARKLYNGYCGRQTANDVLWSIYSDGTLVISGTGEIGGIPGGANNLIDSLSVIRYPVDIITSVIIAQGITSMEYAGFGNCPNLSSITIPGTLTVIGDGAFNNFTNLRNVTVQKGITSIGAGAFSGCSSLSSITIPNSITSIGNGAFSGCSSLSSITIPDSVTSIGSGAFSGCSSLSSIIIPDTVTGIADGTFENCTGLRSITIPTSVTSIGNNAFKGCSGFDRITIHVGVTNIGTGAFDNIRSDAVVYYDGTEAELNNVIGKDNIPEDNILYRVEEGTCGAIGSSVNWTLYNSGALEISGTGVMQDYSDNSFPWYARKSSIKTVTIADGVAVVGNCAFSGCTNLNSVTISDSVTDIKRFAFYGCSGLSRISLSENLTSIDTEAFSGCSSLSSIALPDSVTSIGEYVFKDCIGLRDITISNNMTSIDDGVFLGCSSLSSITLPDGVTSIGEYAFKDCSSLSSIIIPNSVTSIGQEAFRNCSGLSSVTISNSVTSIAYGTFEDCSSLSSITIPVNVTSIGQYAFENCSSLSSIVIPDRVTSIGGMAFYGCTSLSSIIIPGSVTSMGNLAFEYIGDDAVIKYDGYESDWNSKNFAASVPRYATVIYLLERGDCGANGDNVKWRLSSDGILEISGTGAMADYSVTSPAPWSAQRIINTITAVTIKDGITNIGKNAFADCANLNSITIPDSVTSIGRDAFKNMGSNATAPTIYFGRIKARWDALGNDLGIGDNVTVRCIKINITIKADDQSTTVGVALPDDVSKVQIISGSLDAGHSLEGITLTADTSNETTTGTITPGNAIIKSGTTVIDVADNYNITYVDGRLTVIKNNSGGNVAPTPTVPAPQALTLVIDGDTDNRKSENEEGSSHSEDTGYEAFMNDLRGAVKKGTPQILVLNWGNSLSYETMRILMENPQLTLVFNFKWHGVDYSITIGGGRAVYVDKAIPWYGPEYLMGLYGASIGKAYVTTTGNIVYTQVNNATQTISPDNGVYTVQKGDSLLEIVARILHMIAQRAITGYNWIE